MIKWSGFGVFFYFFDVWKFFVEDVFDFKGFEIVGDIYIVCFGFFCIVNFDDMDFLI